MTLNLNLVIFAVLLVLFIGLALCLLIHADRQRRRNLARLRRIRSEVEIYGVKLGRTKLDKHASKSLSGRVQRHLAQTNLKVSVAELLVQISLGVLGLYSILVLLLGISPFFAIPVAVGIPVATVALFIKIAKARYRNAFTEQLPEALDIFARGLRAGRPVSDSLGIVVNTAKGAIHREFSRCYDEICMGTTLPKTLARLETRIPTAEVSFFSVATSLQSETGGNLIETMEGLAGQLRERRKLRKKARALSSEARASAVILAALPFAVTFAIALLNGAYLEPLYADPRGRMMAMVAVTSIVLGVLMMIRMGKLDV
ncbi:type II secretion system F family protein [Pseudorhodobacter sp.]|uniref:type II secretion system F family protein n=1 Tax=Pseudorhodobacter sp. TaxID=1934400 RepID=UPI00264733C3|nr:type II secretion system F family protein [Pseudorhodobacter sp.]MDN5785916.1 type II secretion system F family protein [Pseudorhodobacter sp.]